MFDHEKMETAGGVASLASTEATNLEGEGTCGATESVPDKQHIAKEEQRNETERGIERAYTIAELTAILKAMKEASSQNT